MKALEQFGESEPLNALVIWINQAGELSWSRSASLGRAEAVGLLETVKFEILTRRP